MVTVLHEQSGLPTSMVSGHAKILERKTELDAGGLTHPPRGHTGNLLSLDYS